MNTAPDPGAFEVARSPRIRRASCRLIVKPRPTPGPVALRFAQAQEFVDGNKHTGLACALVSLARNEAALHVNGAELYALTMRVAMNLVDATRRRPTGVHA